MLQETKDLQLRAVDELEQKILSHKREFTFRAPTGSGKTRMMADFMNRVLSKDPNVVFIVSTLSKGDLAQQNYNEFRSCADNRTFPNLNPYLISSIASGEENVFIPLEYNIYVLPRDLYKKNGNLMKGAMLSFLETITYSFFGKGLNKKIYLIKDECHQATNNLDNLSDKFFSKIINFSATPNLRRGQVPDVQITDEEAVQAKLIKNIEFNEDDSVPIDVAIEKFLEIKKDYNNLLQTHPCLIIQISNKDKATQEWEQVIKPAIDKHQELKWMLIVNQDKDCDTNDDVKKKLPVRRWKDYAKQKESTIDIIIFKMVISEGWDIPRACMLYQVRDTNSKQLDEQVMGRVRRNPRLLDFENLSPEAQELAMTAWVWGVKPDSMKKTRQVKLWGSENIDLRQYIRVTTTKINNLDTKNDFDVEQFIQNHVSEPVNTSIFELHSKLSRYPTELQQLCYAYSGNDVSKWWMFMELASEIKRSFESYSCDYEKSMIIDKEVSFPVISSYLESNQSERIKTWVWCRKDGSGARFSFDSEAEREWAKVLIRCESEMDTVQVQEIFKSESRYLWGKNYPFSSEIRFEYYSDGIHASYPDFVMKDKRGRIHIFEVKSVNPSNNQNIDSTEYKAKISVLKKCYKACSAKLRNHLFYLPTMKDDEWTILKYENGQEDIISEEEFIESLRN